MIDVQDCDARLPSSGDTTDLYLDQLVRLSVLVGKVMKNIYTYVSLCPLDLGLGSVRGPSLRSYIYV